MKPRVLVMAFTPLHRDPRVYRHLLALREHYTVVAAGLSDPGIEAVEFVKLPDRRPTGPAHLGLAARLLGKCRAAKVYACLALRRYDQYYAQLPIKPWRTVEALRGHDADLILANDIETLPVAVELANRWQAKLVIDAHEYTPKQRTDDWRSRWFYEPLWSSICRRYLPMADAMTTVSEGIADEYCRNFGVRATVVTNAPPFRSGTPSRMLHGEIRMVHHGGAMARRGLDQLIDLVPLLDEKYRLTLMLVPSDGGVLDRLRRQAIRTPRVSFRDPVPMPQIAEALSEYDLGIHLLPPASLNHRLALPNKLFEFIQGRLAVAIWPSPEMARIVNQYSCGIVSTNFTIRSVADALNALLPAHIDRMKRNSHLAAPILCAERNAQTLLEIVGRTIRGTSSGLDQVSTPHTPECPIGTQAAQ